MFTPNTNRKQLGLIVFTPNTNRKQLGLIVFTLNTNRKQQCLHRIQTVNSIH
jgi:hypothetical protein